MGEVGVGGLVRKEVVGLVQFQPRTLADELPAG
jgi:hypothetical protein